MRIIKVGQFGIGVYNVNGRFYALANYCPHRGGPLCVGSLTGLVVAGTSPYEISWSRAGEFVSCPWHGIEFEIATGASIVDPKLVVRSYPVRIDNGFLTVDEE